jgi:phage terminase small subunit
VRPGNPRADATGMAQKSALTEKELRFCREYACDPNATQAYLKAYGPQVSYGAAREAASVLLTKPNVKAEVDAARREYLRRVGLDATRILRGMTAAAFADMDDCFEPDPANGGLPKPRPWAEIPVATRRAMQGVKLKRRRLLARGKGEATDWEVEELEYKFPDKGAAFDKLFRHLGMYQDVPPLEVILGLLPADLREAVRAHLAAAVLPPGGRAGGGGD